MTPAKVSRWGYRLPKPALRCRFCGRDCQVHGYTYGACDDCVQRALRLLASIHKAKQARSA